MLEHDLITDDDFDGLPEEPEEKFVSLEAICRRNLSRLITNETPSHFDQFIRLRYMSVVSAAAHELGIDGIHYPDHLENPIHAFDDFMLGVASVTMRIRLRNRTSRQYSVQLSPRTKGRIELQINTLRSAIIESDFPPEKKQSLLAKLDELLAELLEKPRLNFAKVMSILAFVGVGLGGTTSFLANAPEAIATITSLIGADKEAEDKETLRLKAPFVPKALPAPVETFVARVTQEDDIPF